MNPAERLKSYLSPSVSAIWVTGVLLFKELNNEQ